MGEQHGSEPTRRGLLVVISGPSGVGKTTIAHAVRERLGAVFSVSATTRPQSNQERDGVDYHFVSGEQFRSMIDAGALLEYAHVFGKHWYGTPRQPVDETLAAGRIVILDIDVQGALQIRRAMPEAFLIFILPPGDEELMRRLRGRGRDDQAAIQRRFEKARGEIALARSSGAYDAFVVNDDLPTAQNEACELITARLSGPSATH
jgi:guanylate kinase